MVDKIRRMHRIFGKDGKAFIVAMDHCTFNGANPGLENPAETLEQVAEGGADAVLVNMGVARAFAKELAPLGFIARMDLPPTYLGEGHNSRLVYDVDYALRLGADAVIVNIGQGVGVEETTFASLAKMISYCDQWGLPVCAEAVPGGFDADKSFATLDNVAKAARIACEIGCDFMKIRYLPNFERVIRETFVPAVVLGGSKSADPRDFLQQVHDALQAGASGVAAGRNIWGCGRTVRMVKAVSAMIHKGISVDEAVGILNA